MKWTSFPQPENSFLSCGIVTTPEEFLIIRASLPTRERTFAAMSHLYQKDNES